MTIVDAIEELVLEGLDTPHDHEIETVLSKLFVRGDLVYKAYKHRKADFADLTQREVRRRYITEDFIWNNVMSPDIYLELRHVAQSGDQYIHTSIDDAEDMYIIMKKVDTTNDLLSMLRSGKLNREDLSSYTNFMIDRFADLTERYANDLKEHIDKGQAHVRSEIMGTCDWAYTADPYLSVTDVDSAKAVLQTALDTDPYFTGPQTLSVVIDTNPDNIIFVDGTIAFLDVMPPKDSWRVHDSYFALTRTSADVSLFDSLLANVIHESYGAKRGVRPSSTVRMAYELAAALIQAPYRKMIGQNDLAERYAQLVKARTNELQQSLRTA